MGNEVMNKENNNGQGFETKAVKTIVEKIFETEIL